MKRMQSILLGAAYYPEHDEPAEWRVDAVLMRDLGLNCVRIGEFAWSRMQQADGTLTLDWLEEVIETLAAAGIKTVLSTPTATPPAWICERYPDLAPLGADGRPGLFGGRRHYSVFHPGYQADCEKIAAALGARFGRHEAVVGWQLDNEAGSYFTVDCSAPAHRAFIAWLEKKYATPAELNRNWGLIFWNQEVERFDQIPVPLEMMSTRNPSMLLDYNRFCIEGVARFLLRQAMALRAQVPADKFIVASCVETAMGAFLELQKELPQPPVDAVTVHNYPELLPEPVRAATHLSRFHCLAQAEDMPLLVMEQQLGSGHTTTGGLDPEIRRFWAWEALAAGVKSILWFHWRRFRTGCEWRLTPILERDRRPRGIYRSLQSLICEVRKVEPLLLNAEILPDAQVLYDRDNILGFDRASEAIFWMQIQLPDAPRHRKPLWERALLGTVCQPLARLGMSPKFVKPEHDWDTALPLIALDLDICTPAMVEKLRRFCEDGGTLVCFAGAGERDAHGAHHQAPPPGILSGLLGVELEDYYPLAAEAGVAFDHQHGTAAAETGRAGTTAQIRFGAKSIPMDIRHGEILAPGKDAEAVAEYVTGGVAVSRRRVGRGQAFYIGAFPASAAAGAELYRQLLPGCPVADQAYRRVRLRSGGRNYRFLLNGTPATVPLPKPRRDLITGKDFSELPPYAAILAED